MDVGCAEGAYVVDVYVSVSVKVAQPRDYNPAVCQGVVFQVCFAWDLCGFGFYGVVALATPAVFQVKVRVVEFPLVRVTFVNVAMMVVLA